MIEQSELDAATNLDLFLRYQDLEDLLENLTHRRADRPMYELLRQERVQIGHELRVRLR